MEHFIGIDLGGTEIKIGIIKADGKIIIKDSFPTDMSKSADDILAYMADCARQVVAKAGLDLKKDVKGLGIGSPGILDPEKGITKIVVNIPQLNGGVEVAAKLTGHLGIPVYLDNDVNAMALGEFYFGAAKGYTDVVALTLGTGVGGGLIFDGKLYRGACFAAGEIGHISIDPDGMYCPCGNYGCLEKYVGRDGIIQRFKMAQMKGIETNIDQFLDKGEITPRAIAMAAQAGDALSLEVLADTGRILGNVMASLTNVLNPQVFVIGGGISNAGDLILEPARRELKRRAYTVPAAVVKVVRAALGNDAGIVGSASLAVAKLN